jgi:uncharacterized protein YecT (DUF1311 family)
MIGWAGWRSNEKFRPGAARSLSRQFANSGEKLSIGFRTFRTRVAGIALLCAFCVTVGGFPPRGLEQDKQEALPCSSETTTAGMRSCENQRYERAQKALDAAYDELMKKLDDTGKAKLRSAQSAWLQFRQADADFEADTARGGTLAPLIKITVMADLTEARAAELKKALEP